MGAHELLISLRNAGLILTADGPNIRVEPRAALTDGLRAIIRERKSELLAVLSGTWTAASEEVAPLVERVAQGNGFTPAEREEAMTRALADPEPALTCFKHLAAAID